MSDKKQVSKEDFEVFKKECDKWISFFGLCGWRIFYEFIDAGEDCYAQIRYNLLDRVATITLNLFIYDETERTEVDVKRSAFHEVCELLLARISLFGKERFVNENEIDEEIHNLIRIFENTIFTK